MTKIYYKMIITKKRRYLWNINYTDYRCDIAVHNSLISLAQASEIKEIIFLDTEVPIPHTMVLGTIVAIFLRLTRRGSYYCRLHNPLLLGSCFLNGYKKKNMFYRSAYGFREGRQLRSNFAYAS